MARRTVTDLLNSIQKLGLEAKLIKHEQHDLPIDSKSHDEIIETEILEVVDTDAVISPTLELSFFSKLSQEIMVFKESYGATMSPEELQKENISAEVIDLRTIRPLDWFTILESVKKTNRLVIVEEQWPFASVSSELSYRIQKEGFDYLDAPIRRITSADAPMHYAPNLTALAIPDVTRTVKLIKEVMHQYK